MARLLFPWAAVPGLVEAELPAAAEAAVPGLVEVHSVGSKKYPSRLEKREKSFVSPREDA